MARLDKTRSRFNKLYVPASVLSSGPAVNNLTNGGLTTVSASQATASVSPTANALVLLAITMNRANGVAASAPSSVTGCGLTWVLDSTTTVKNSGGGDYSYQYIFRAQGAAPTPGAVTINSSYTGAHNMRWAMLEVTNVVLGDNGGNSILQRATGTNSATLAAFGKATNVTIAFAGCYNENANSATGGLTLLNSGFTSLAGASSAYKLGAATTPGFGREFGGSCVVTALEVMDKTAPALANLLVGYRPISYTKLNEAAGNFANLGATGGDGVLSTTWGTGGTRQGATGPDGNYLDLGNGNPSYVGQSDANAWSEDNTNTRSLFCLIKPDNLTQGQYVWTKGNGSPAYEWGLSIGTTGQISYSTHSSAGATFQNESTDLASTGIVVAAQWNAIAVSKTLSGGARFKIYRNSGTASASSAAAQSGFSYTNGGARPFIGWREDFEGSGNTQYFRGGVAHFAMFNRQLTDAEVQALMDAAHNDGWI